MAMTTIFNFTSYEEFRNTDIDFHTHLGLIDNFTAMQGKRWGDDREGGGAVEID